MFCDVDKVRNDDEDFRRKYYISPPKLLNLLNNENQPKNSKHTSKRLEYHMKSSLMGSAAIARALEMWRCMVSFMPFSDYTDEHILNSVSSLGRQKYSNVEDTVFSTQFFNCL